MNNGLYRAFWRLHFYAGLIVLPVLGVAIYLIAKGRGMAGRDFEQARAAQAEFDGYVKSVAASSGSAAEIDKAKRLLDNGTIDQAEYESLKAKALA